MRISKVLQGLTMQLKGRKARIRCPRPPAPSQRAPWVLRWGDGGTGTVQFFAFCISTSKRQIADYHHQEGCVVVNIALLHGREVVFNHLWLTYGLQHHV